MLCILSFAFGDRIQDIHTRKEHITELVVLGIFPNYLPTYSRTWMKFQHKGNHKKAVAWWVI